MVATLLAVLLASCGHVDRPAQPARVATIAKPSARETAQCHADLTAEGVSFKVLPDRDDAAKGGGGCGIAGAVQLTDIGVPVTNLTAVRCGEARAFTAWVRNAVAPAAYQMLGSEIARVDTSGSYACRNVVGSGKAAGRRSGHAIANAVDFAGVSLKDGRRVSVLDDWASSDAATHQFLQTIRASACKRFGTVLSPDYNAAHRNHFHLEDDRVHFCR